MHIARTDPVEKGPSGMRRKGAKGRKGAKRRKGAKCRKGAKGDYGREAKQRVERRGYLSGMGGSRAAGSSSVPCGTVTSARGTHPQTPSWPPILPAVPASPSSLSSQQGRCPDPQCAQTANYSAHSTLAMAPTGPWKRLVPAPSRFPFPLLPWPTIH